MKIASVRSAFPSHWYDQSTITESLVRLMGLEGRAADRLRLLHGNCGIDGRHLVQPLERYDGGIDFTGANATWLRGALELGERACRDALAAAGVRAD